MNLIIEVGNTKAKYALFNGEEVVAVDKKKTDNNFNTAFLPKINFDRCIVAGSGKINQRLWKGTNIDMPIFFENSLIKNIKLKYESPEKLGQDRMINAFRAVKLFPKQSNLIIDLGTCMTFTFISDQNELLGGSISPGMAMRTKSLKDYTEGLPKVSIEHSVAKADLIGNNTVNSIMSGVIMGCQYELNSRIAEYEKLYKNLNIILTGGDAVFFEDKINYKIFADPHFTLKGLNDILMTL